MSDFIPAHDIFEATGSVTPPSRTALLCHGILGNRNNWRTFARALVQRRPELRVISVDLRNHGDSTGAQPPHSLAACAADLRALQRHLDLRAEVLIGHSFGGKVVLEAARADTAAGSPGPLTVFVLDATPTAGEPGREADLEVSGVMRCLRAVPQPLADRQAVVAPLVAEGISLTLARWMTTNLGRGPDGWRWRFDIDACEQMLGDYFTADYMDFIATPRADLQVHLLRAARSDRWSAALIRALEALPAGAPARLHLLPEAGHWVHADNPAGLLDFFDLEL